MLRLSTYLGHVKPDRTYWYIEAYQVAAARLEARGRLAAEDAPRKGGAR
jgi:hypothetical protein